MSKPTTAFFRASVAAGILFAGHAGLVQAADITVCPSGCDQVTIAAGLAAANPGDVVVVGTPGRVAPEIYNENIQMKDDVSLVSEGDATTAIYTDTLGGTGYSTTVLKRAAFTIIHGGGSSAVVTFPFTMTTNTLLDGFTIENVDAIVADWTALVLIGGTSPTIQNNIIRDNRGPAHNGGITMIGGISTASPLIQNNVIHYMNGPGIGLRSNTAPTIIGNEIFTTPPDVYQFSPGIGLADDATATILNNKLFQNGRAGVGSVEFGVADTGVPIVIKGNVIHDHMPWGGVRITGQTGSTNVLVEIGGPNAADSNEFYGNLAGVRLDHQEIGGRMASALIQNNNFYNNGVGVRAENMTSVTIIDNTMNNQVSFCAVRAGNSELITIQRNEMHNNNFCGIRIWQDASTPDVDIRNNNISNNGFGGIRLDNSGMTGIVTENHIHQNSRGGMVILAGMTMEISNNEINHNIRGAVHTGLDLANGAGFMDTNGSADLTIRGNKVHNNGQGALGGGIDVRHASGTIENNLVYKNNMGGIRYGNWVEAINNNTVVGNGRGGIVFDDLAGEVNQNPPQGSPDPSVGPLPNPPLDVASIQNNVLVGNANAGINAGTLYSGGSTCSDHVGFRQYNLLSGNNGQAASCPPFGPWCRRPQLGMCDPNIGEVFVAPQFVNSANDNYRLIASSPAVDAGNPDVVFDDVSLPPGVGLVTGDMGAYGGPFGITW